MRYVCRICGHIYDETKEKVPFDQLPDTWKCPLCGAAKRDFEPEKSNQTVSADKPKPVIREESLEELSAGQLSALCSNLARGCEKQYKTEEAGLFRELAEYFARASAPANDATVERVAALLQDDLNRYTDVRSAADQAADRGAARVCVWGEKVTRMLSSLVARYQSEGDALLDSTGIWVCTICGFVYIGENAPELCPVCKVPSWKFEKIEGRA